MITLNESIAMPLQRTVLVRDLPAMLTNHDVQEALTTMVSKELHRIIITNPEDDDKPVGIVRYASGRLRAA